MKSGLYGRTGGKYPVFHIFKENEPLVMPVERFLSLLRFEKLGEIG